MNLAKPLRRRLPGRAGRRLLLEWLGVGLVASGLVLWLCLGGGADRANSFAYDALMKTRGGKADDRILIVGIDNRSLEALGRWPWPRDIHADLIKSLDDAGAAAVGYDVLFVEPGPGDDRLVQALSRSGDVFLPMAVDPLAGRDPPLLLPRPALAEAAAGLGHVNLTADPDGVVRRLPPGLTGGNVWYPHLALKLAETAGPIPGASRPPARGPDPMLLTWRGPPGHYRTVSFVDVLRGEVPPEMLKGRLVLVGMTADGQGDRYAGPAGGGRLYPGVEIQAALLDTLLSGGAIRIAPPWLVSLVSLALLWLVMAFLLVLGPTRGLISAGLAVLAVLAGAAAAFHLGVWFPPAAAAAGVLLAWPLWSWRRLEAAAAWFRGQLDTFVREDAIVAPVTGGEPLQRQLDAMRWALDRLRNLGRFIGDALKSLPDATLVVAGDGRILMANERADVLFGASPIGRDLDEALGALGLAPAPAARERVTRSGLLLDVEEAPLVDASGAAVARIVRLADVTAIRTAQRQREEALQLLSHDMRTPQISTLALVEKAGDAMAPDLSRRISANARLTLRMAENYVQFARAESQPLVLGLVDLLDVITDAADTLWPQAQGRGVRMDLPDAGGPAGMAEIEGDRPALTRAVLNLLDNAVKFSPAGSTVDVSLEPHEDENGLWWLCAIEDRGPGVPVELCQRIFRPFERVDERPGGVGLGLALVRIVAERHGGSARCEARTGGGARLVLLLPRGG